MKRGHSSVVTSNLDFTSQVPVQTAIEDTQYVEYPCFTALPKDDETPLEFRIDKSDAFVDINNTYLQIQIQILKADGSEMKTKIDAKGNITSVDLVAPVNNIGYALFDNVDLFISERKVTETDNTYPWWTYIYQLLYNSPLIKKTSMRGNCWFEDTGGQFDKISMKVGGDINKGFKNRYGVFNDSAKVTLFVPLLLNKRIDRLLPPQTEIMLRFNRAPTTLSLLAKKDSVYKIKIWDARLFVSRVRLSDSALRNYARLLSSKGFVYNVDSCYTRVKTVSKGDQNVDWTPFIGAMPKRIYFWQITHEAYNAKIEQNMYNFQSFYINKFQCFKNGSMSPLTTGYVNIQTDDYLKLYHFTTKAINSPSTFNIEQSDFNFGYLIIVVDLSADGNATAVDYKNPAQSGTLRLSIDYAKPLEGSATLFCLGEYTEKLTIDGRTHLPLLITDGT